MKWLVDILKSRGKLGGVGLIVLGLGMAAYVGFTQGAAGSYTEPIGLIFAGLALLGIRAKQDAPPA